LTKILIIYILNIHEQATIYKHFKHSSHFQTISSFWGLAGSRSLGGLGKLPPFAGLAGSRSLGGLCKVPLHHLIPLNSIVGLVHSTQSGPTEDDGNYCSGHKGEGFDLAVLFVAALVVSVVSSSIGQSVGEDAVNLDAISGVGVEVGIHDVRRV